MTDFPAAASQDMGSVSFAAVAEALNRAGKCLRRAVNPVVMSRTAFEAKLAGRDRFMTRVAREPKIFLLGDAGVRSVELRDRQCGFNGQWAR